MEKRKLARSALIWSFAIPASKVSFGAIDFIVYPLAQASWGFAIGSIAVSFLLLTLSTAMMFFYDWLKEDLFAIEAIKTAIGKGERSRFPILAWIFQCGSLIAPGILAFMYQPFKVTIYCRKPPYVYHQQIRHWILLAICWLIRSIYWSYTIWYGRSLLEILIGEIRKSAGC